MKETGAVIGSHVSILQTIEQTQEEVINISLEKFNSAANAIKPGTSFSTRDEITEYCKENPEENFLHGLRENIYQTQREKHHITIQSSTQQQLTEIFIDKALIAQISQLLISDKEFYKIFIGFFTTLSSEKIESKVSQIATEGQQAIIKRIKIVLKALNVHLDSSPTTIEEIDSIIAGQQNLKAILEPARNEIKKDYSMEKVIEQTGHLIEELFTNGELFESLSKNLISEETSRIAFAKLMEQLAVEEIIETRDEIKHETGNQALERRVESSRELILDWIEKHFIAFFKTYRLCLEVEGNKRDFRFLHKEDDTLLLNAQYLTTSEGRKSIPNARKPSHGINVGKLTLYERGGKRAYISSFSDYLKALLQRANGHNTSTFGLRSEVKELRLIISDTGIVGKSGIRVSIDRNNLHFTDYRSISGKTFITFLSKLCEDFGIELKKQ